MMGPTEQIAHYVSTTSFEDIPPEAVERSKDTMLDTIGLMIAGVSEPCGQIAIKFAQAEGGTQAASVFGTSVKTSTTLAAFANGVTGHAHECDDADLPVVIHPSVVTLPAIFALGEQRGATGKDIFEAYIIGWEVIGAIGRMLQPAHIGRGWHPTATIGTFGAAAAAAKILGLTKEQVLMALGIASSGAAGIKLQDGTMGKPLHAGNAARNGVHAALLARDGFTAAPNILEAKAGVAEVYNGPGTYDLSQVSKLGNPYTLVDPGPLIKKYACTATFQVTHETVQELAKRESVGPDDIESVEVGISTLQNNITRYPKDRLDCKFSEEFAVASGVVFPDLFGIEPYTQERVEDHRIQALMKRVKVYLHPDLMEPTITNMPVHYLDVKLKDGREFKIRGEKARGYPGNAMSQEQLLTKYDRCVQTNLTGRAAEDSRDIIYQLDKEASLDRLVGALTPRSSTP